MRALAELCVRRPVFATMLIVSLTIVGLYSFMGLGVDLMPNVDLPTVSVTVTNPGAFPILFSALSGSGNRLTATVPTNTGQTVYVAGSATVSQGAVAATGAGPWTIN